MELVRKKREGEDIAEESRKRCRRKRRYKVLKHIVNLFCKG